MATLFSNILDVLIVERLGARFGLNEELKCRRSISLRSESPNCLSRAMKYISVHFPYIFSENLIGILGAGHPKEYRSSESCREVSTCDPWDVKGGVKAELQRKEQTALTAHD
ncbi:unnamed protein product [Porites lobata]|uniref:Uncharacterized protein n=1 Tax=Porites lobata TaxID=104759 RepID=A0ABN8RQG8_9CNID|nr:unnamed protein product [Porites lobata]